jgi:hypothetical protein
MSDEWTEIELLDGFEDALLGCVFDPEGSPVPCYCSRTVMLTLQSMGLSEDQAMETAENLTEGMRMVWVYPLELDDGPPVRRKPDLRIVH